MTLNMSAGPSRASASCSAALACSIDAPAIEPELSMTKTTSRGWRRAASAAGDGGVTTSRP